MMMIVLILACLPPYISKHAQRDAQAAPTPISFWWYTLHPSQPQRQSQGPLLARPQTHDALYIFSRGHVIYMIDRVRTGPSHHRTPHLPNIPTHISHSQSLYLLQRIPALGAGRLARRAAGLGLAGLRAGGGGDGAREGDEERLERGEPAGGGGSGRGGGGGGGSRLCWMDVCGGRGMVSVDGLMGWSVGG